MVDWKSKYLKYKLKQKAVMFGGKTFPEDLNDTL